MSSNKGKNEGLEESKDGQMTLALLVEDVRNAQEALVMNGKDIRCDHELEEIPGVLYDGASESQTGSLLIHEHLGLTRRTGAT